MARKFQTYVPGGTRKVIQQPNTTVGTTIAEFGSGTVTLEQLAQALANLTPPDTGTSGSPSTAQIAVGPGLSGGGPVIGVVPIGLTIPVGAHMLRDDEVGEQGERGIPGTKGDAGAQGSRGFPGEDGSPGEDGTPGPTGPQGPQGPQGPAGAGSAGNVAYPWQDDPDDPQVIPGPQGTPGAPGAPGATGSPGPQGVPGTMWLQDDPDDPLLIPGPQGTPGAPGSAGAQGTQGVRGPPGEDGEVGEDGRPGSQGPAGVAGPTGAQGPVGGPTIVTFDDPDDLWMIPGPQGPQGIQGIQGPAGSGGGGPSMYPWQDEPDEANSQFRGFGPANNPSTTSVFWRGDLTWANTLFNDGVGIAIQQLTTAGYAIARLNNQAGTRKLEMVAIGSAAAAVYGAAAGDAVINVNTGTLWLSTADLGRVSISTNGNVAIAAPTSGTALTVTGLASANDTVAIVAPNVSGQSNGLYIQAGTITGDNAIHISKADGTTQMFKIRGDGSGFISPTSGGLTWAAAGNFSIAAPSSGTTLTVGALSASISIAATTGSTTAQFAQVATISSSGGDFPYFGYNLNATAVAGTYKYAVTDFASGIQFISGGMQFKTAPSGTAAAGITLSTVLAIPVDGSTPTFSGTSASTKTQLGVSSIAAKPAFTQYSVGGVLNVWMGVVGTAADLITGSAATDLVIVNRTAAGKILFGTNNAIAAAIDINGIFYTLQPTPTAVNATATLTIAQMLTTIITSTTAAATNLTLPTGTLTDAGILGGNAPTNFSFDWSVINTGPSTLQLLVGTSHGIVGSGTILTLKSGRFRTRKTAANTYVTYQLS